MGCSATVARPAGHEHDHDHAKAAAANNNTHAAIVLVKEPFPAGPGALPKMFRVALDKDAAPVLGIGGCGQFSENNIAAARDHIVALPGNTRKNVIIVDLREESHGFLNGEPICWRAKANLSNYAMSLTGVRQEEQLRILGVNNNPTQVVAKYKNVEDGDFEVLGEETVVVQHCLDEEATAKKLGIGYIRIPVTDHRMPEPRDVDEFLAFYKSLKPEDFCVYHCFGGKGRTTSFMVMHEVLSTVAAGLEPLETTVRRHEEKGGKIIPKTGAEVPPDKQWKQDEALARWEFLQGFYKYAKTGYQQGVPYSQWVVKK